MHTILILSSFKERGKSPALPRRQSHRPCPLTTARWPKRATRRSSHPAGRPSKRPAAIGTWKAKNDAALQAEKKLQQDASVQRDIAAKQQAEAVQRPSQTN